MLMAADDCQRNCVMLRPMLSKEGGLSHFHGVLILSIRAQHCAVVQESSAAFCKGHSRVRPLMGSAQPPYKKLLACALWEWGPATPTSLYYVSLNVSRRRGAAPCVPGRQ